MNDPAVEVTYPSWGRVVWRRFRGHPLAIIGTVLFGLVLLLAIVGPAFAPAPPPAALTDTSSPAVVAETQKIDVPPQFSWRYLMGTDQNAMPVLREVLVGGRDPLEIGILGALLATILGITLGAISGYVGGWVDTIAMRTVDAFLAMPFIPLILLTVSNLTLPILAGAAGTAVLFGLLGWAGTARLVRGYILGMREQEYVAAARALGASDPAIVFRHLLPNVLGVIVVALTLNVAVFLAAEVAIEFLQGESSVASPLGETWGQEMYAGYLYLAAYYWWPAFFPAVVLVIALLGVNLLGDGLRDAIEGSITGWTIGEGTLREPGQVRRAVSLRTKVAGALVLAAAGALNRLPRPRLRVQVLRLPRWAIPARISRAIAVAVPTVLTVGFALAFLLHLAPTTYAPNYTDPSQVATDQADQGYAAAPAPHAGWDAVYTDAAGRLAVSLDPPARHQTIVPVAPSPNNAQPAIASSRQGQLVIWTGSYQSGQALWARRIIGGRASKRLLLAHGPAIEIPSIVTTRAGWYVLFGALSGSRADIYRSSVPLRGLPHTQLLIRAANYDAEPLGIMDGSGHLNVIYLDLCCGQTAWDVQFARFDARGRRLGKPVTITQLLQLTKPGQVVNAAPQIPAAITRAPDGSVWAVVQGDVQLYVGHWSATGRPLFPPSPLCTTTICLSATDSLGLAPARGRLALFYMSPTVGAARPFAAFIRQNGTASAPQRVDYGFGGQTRGIQAGVVNGVPSVTWEKDLANGTGEIQTSSYRPAQPPDLAERFALNIGPAWANAAVLVVGAIVAAAPLTLLNVFLLALLFLIWVFITWLFRGSVRWTLYGIALAVVLVLSFTLPSTAPPFVFLLPAWSGVYGWLAALGAAAIATWVGYFGLRHQDDAFRALGMALVAVYVLSVLAALVGIQHELAQI